MTRAPSRGRPLGLGDAVSESLSGDSAPSTRARTRQPHWEGSQAGPQALGGRWGERPDQASMQPAGGATLPHLAALPAPQPPPPPWVSLPPTWGCIVPGTSCCTIGFWVSLPTWLWPPGGTKNIFSILAAPSPSPGPGTQTAPGSSEETLVPTGPAPSRWPAAPGAGRASRGSCQAAELGRGREGGDDPTQRKSALAARQAAEDKPCGASGRRAWPLKPFRPDILPGKPVWKIAAPGSPGDVCHPCDTP